MFSALIKAFTGRAGFLASLLALLLIAVASAAVLLSLPRIELKLEDSAQAVLGKALADSDSLVSVSAQGRNLELEGEFEDAAGLTAALESIDGVRSVVINSGMRTRQVSAELPSPEVVVTADPVSKVAEQQESAEVVMDAGNTDADVIESEATDETPQVAEQALLSEGEPEDVPTSGEPLAQLATDPDQNGLTPSSNDGYDQSSLSLRYDGTQLSLSGHLADEQMAQLIAERVGNLIPAHSQLEIDVDGKGKGSPLNWMEDFLKVISGLPDDAQGLIEGSDSQGVKIIPDVEQTLTRRAQFRSKAPELDDKPVVDATVDIDTQSSGDISESESESGLEVELEVVVSDAELSDSGLANDVITEGQAEAGAVNEDSALVLEAVPEEVAGTSVVEPTMAIQPQAFITDLNARIAAQASFKSGEFSISKKLAIELNRLAQMMQQHPDLLLRVVGNIDFSVERRIAEYVGIDRAREIRRYLYAQGVEPFRVFAMPLPRDRAFDKRVQVVFYISE